ncbi:MAG TPA: hydrogenase expression/formation protein HypE [Chitinivibrionales bacterium]|nr:hydrogenase expression/formation protein HypE [Chitinivibrionales bacterium]
MSVTTIRMSHGSGRGNKELLESVVLPALVPGGTGVLEDAFIFDIPGRRFAFTTDSFVVTPLEFPGGDIGKLAACGTINDLAMMGAQPAMITVSLVLEEGLDAALLAKMLRSLSAVCASNGMRIAGGDTKVVEKGKADGMYITTSGIGIVKVGVSLSAANAKPGDAVIVSGAIGLHGITVLSQRKNLHFASTAVSDCAPLWALANLLLSSVPVRTLRDATRGGLAAILCEIADASKASIVIHEDAVPVPEVVRGACAFLGMDPLHIANEGRFAAIVPAEAKDKALAAMHSHPDGKEARVIGYVAERGKFPVLMKTVIGATRPVEMPQGELLPRIC